MPIGFIRIICATAILFAPHSSVAELSLRFEKLFSNSRYLEEQIGEIERMIQDHNGFVWIGGNIIVRYDGTYVKRYGIDETRSDPVCTSHFNDFKVHPSGDIWLAAERGLCRHRANEDYIEHVSPENYPNIHIGNDYIHTLDVGPSGHIYVASNNAITIIEPDLNTSKTYPIPPHYLENISNSLRAINRDAQGNIWIGTTHLGTFILWKGANTLERVIPPNIDESQYNRIRSISSDALNRVWIGTHNMGVWRYDLNTQKFKQYAHQPDNSRSIANNFIYDIAITQNNDIWVMTNPGGLQVYNPLSDDFDRVAYNPRDENSFRSEKALRLLSDKTNNIWVSFWPTGVDIHDHSTAHISSFRKSDDKTGLIDNGILTFLEDKKGRIWVGTEGGLTRYDPRTKKFTPITKNDPKRFELGHAPVLSLAEGEDDKIWIGTWRSGLYLYNTREETFEKYYPGDEPPGKLGSLIAWSLYYGGNDQLLVGTETVGVLDLNTATLDYSHAYNSLDAKYNNGKDHIWSIFKSQQGILWTVTIYGIYQHGGLNSPNIRFLETLRTRSAFEDKSGRIWVGTEGLGIYIYNPMDDSLKHLGKAEGLPSISVTGVIEDNNNDYWVSTYNGLFKVNHNDFTITPVPRSAGLASHSFNRRGLMMSSNGDIYAGGTNGFSIFDPSKMLQPKKFNPPKIVNLRIDNQTVHPLESSSLLTRPIYDTRSLTIDHTVSMVTLELSSLNYNPAIASEFSYKLEGYDKSWVDIGRRNVATYTNLPAGRYTFHARTKNGEQKNFQYTDPLDIVVLPPPWKTLWAYGIYCIILAIVSLSIINHRKRKLALLNAETLNNELHRLNEIKDQFLANTSHELRTPLNGIIGIASELGRRISTSDTEKQEMVSLIISCGRRLTSLVNDLLDHAKMENRGIELHRRTVNLNNVVNDVFSILSPLAKDKNIVLNNNLDETACQIIADPDRLHQILTNLISNGIKYTDVGSVTVSAEVSENCFNLNVSDTGIGITPDKFQNLFTPFDQLSDDDHRTRGGTGLGLVVTKQLVEMHQGELVVKSTPNEGSTFTVQLPASVIQAKTMTSPDNDSEYTDSYAEAEIALDGVTIMVVDDDPINRMILGALLNKHRIHVIDINSAMKALEYLENSSNKPVDLIISDVNMPSMSGVEMQIALKERTCDTPIIFVTANSNKDAHQEYRAAGGVAVLTKPIVKNELLKTLHQTLRKLSNGSSPKP